MCTTDSFFCDFGMLLDKVVLFGDICKRICKLLADVFYFLLWLLQPCHLICCCSTGMVLQLLHRGLLWQPQKEELKERSHQKKLGAIYWNMIFAYYCAWAFLSKKPLQQRKSPLELKLLYSEIQLFLIWLSKFWFHSILHLTIQQEECTTRENSSSSTNKQSVTKRTT